MNTVPPLIVSVPDPDNRNQDGTAHRYLQQQGLPDFLTQVPVAMSDAKKTEDDQDSFQQRLAMGQKYEKHLAGYLLSRHSHVILISPGFSLLNNAPRLVSPHGALTQPDFLAIQDGNLSWWESKYREDVHTFLRKHVWPDEVGIMLRHWKDYCQIWTDLSIPFYLVFAVERKDAVVFADIEELRDAITRIDDRPNKKGDSIVHFNYQKLHYLMSFSDYIKL